MNKTKAHPTLPQVVLDLTLILIPFISLVDANVVENTSYVMFGFMTIAALAPFILSEEKIVEVHGDQSTGYLIYDLGTDILFIMSWSYFEYYGLALMYFLTKMLMLSKVYHLRRDSKEYL